MPHVSDHTVVSLAGSAPDSDPYTELAVRCAPAGRQVMRVLAVSAMAFAVMMAWADAEGVDVHILGFRFGCETPDGKMRKPKFGDVGGIFFTGLPEERKPCLETIDRMIYSCQANTTFISHDLNRTYAACLPIFEKQAQECIAHFDRERAKCNAGSDEESREAQALDSRQDDENGTWDASEDGVAASDAWKPWEDQTTADNDEVGEDAQWVEVEDPNDDYELDDGGGNCEDVWADCPRNTYWTEEQQEGARRVELWVNYAEPQANAQTDPRDDGWGYEADGALGATSESGDAVGDARKDYERALAGLLNGGRSSASDVYTASNDDYRAVLEEMDAQAEKRARMELEKAEEHRSNAATASRNEATGTAEDGTCGSAPACRNYIRHGEQVLAQVNHIRPTSMTDGALLTGFVVRSTLGCMKKCLPHERSSACQARVRSAISEYEQTYRSAIASAKGSAADSGYVDEFDRDPRSSRFVRNLGIRISGTSLDSCGD